MSRAIVETQRLFAKFDENGDGFIGREEFERAFHHFFRDDYTLLKQMLEDDALFRNHLSGDVDYITWSMMLAPRHLPQIIQGCRTVGPLSLASPTEQEVELMDKMFQRGHDLAIEAMKCGTRLLIDAEQVRFQPAIDHLVLDLQRQHNTQQDFPLIYNTYQCYLKDAMDRLKVDVARSERFSYHFGAKLVRGAYMESEREMARARGDEASPIHETKAETDHWYDQAAEYLLTQSVNEDRQSGKTIELMLATHSQQSIETAIAVMNKLGIDRTDNTLSFGQLFGMMDNLSYGLGHHGYRVYK
jgi:proline dehydrogenase